MKDLWHGLPSRSSDEDLTAPNTVKKPIKKGRYQGQRCIQAIMVVIPAVVEGVALLAAIVPFGLHRWNMHKWTVAHAETHVPQPSEEEIPLTVLLPVWNEARIIEKKLDDLAKQSVSFSLLLIDSASDDRTVELAKKWLQEHPHAFTTSEVLVMGQREGKTSAVIRALNHLNQNANDGLVCMTDADARLGRGVLRRLMDWFSDPMIGAVGALPQRTNAREEELGHRAMWENMRVSESYVDSTPFLEGSCMMWRKKTLPVEELNPTANADDAQIATAIRCQGWRVIVDDQAVFYDAAPELPSEQRRQKIRRAQGLQRLLVRRRKDGTGKRHGVFSTIIKRQFHFHITAPLAVGIASLSAVLRWGFIGLYGWPATFTLANSLHMGLCTMEAVLLGLWWRARSGKTSGPLSLLGQWLSSMELLMRSLVTSARGRSLHMWQQHTDVRETMVAEFEN